MVSGPISLPFLGAFQLSFTVLCAIGCQRVFSLGQWTGRIPTRFLVLGSTWEQCRFWLLCFIYRTITFCSCFFQSIQLHNNFLTERSHCNEIKHRPTTSHIKRLQAIIMWDLGYSLFARRYWGNIFVFSSSRYWDVSLPSVLLLFPMNSEIALTV